MGGFQIHTAYEKLNMHNKCILYIYYVLIVHMYKILHVSMMKRIHDLLYKGVCYVG